MKQVFAKVSWVNYEIKLQDLGATLLFVTWHEEINRGHLSRHSERPRQLEIDENAVRISQEVGYLEEDRGSKSALFCPTNMAGPVASRVSVSAWEMEKSCVFCCKKWMKLVYIFIFGHDKSFWANTQIHELRIVEMNIRMLGSCQIKDDQCWKGWILPFSWGYPGLKTVPLGQTEQKPSVEPQRFFTEVRRTVEWEIFGLQVYRKRVIKGEIMPGEDAQRSTVHLNFPKIKDRCCTWYHQV